MRQKKQPVNARNIESAVCTNLIKFCILNKRNDFIEFDGIDSMVILFCIQFVEKIMQRYFNKDQQCEQIASTTDGELILLILIFSIDSNFVLVWIF